MKKMRKRKMKKKMMNNEKNEEIWLHTQNPRRFSRVYRCCCIFFSSICSTISMIFVSECVSFQRKINNPFLGSQRFFLKKSDTFSLDVQQKNTHFYRQKSTKPKFAKVSPSNTNKKTNKQTKTKTQSLTW